MKLTAFRVTNFRSVEDSGWIEIGEVTALIGTNESGKTNLLMPLWKLNPAKDGEVKLLTDAPRKRYNEIRSMKVKPIFIEALCELDDSEVEHLVQVTGAPPSEVRVALVGRRLDGETHFVTFPESRQREVQASRAAKLLSRAQEEITRAIPTKPEEGLKEAMLAAIATSVTELESYPAQLSPSQVKNLDIEVRAVNLDAASKRSTIAPHFSQLQDGVAGLLSEVSLAPPSDVAEARNYVWKRLPKFVYYSNYGNLDSEIYLPHVIQNMERDDLGSREEAKVRTLKVLFEFVRLQPQEILDLGQDFRPPSHNPSKTPSDEEIAKIAEDKKERSVLLQSAGTELTSRFREWWRQGDYRFRFEADGDHFRIWVADDKRPEEIELEGRSTGLQWFLSFYLIFLVESKDAHEGAILLLDEPGLSLHPIAQRDLSEFFANLASTNQIVYTTHSPFMVDPDQLDRVKAVFTSDDGTTAVSANLRASESQTAQSRSIYPVYAALGLSISDTLLQGCQPVIVEGMADQHYLTAMKNLLIAAGRIRPKRDLIFIPAGGTKGISAVVSIVTGKEQNPPFVLLDSDSAGEKLATQLRNQVYQADKTRVLQVGTFSAIPGAEIEDLIPSELMVFTAAKWLKTADDFGDVFKAGQPIVNQIEAHMIHQGKALPIGWKVELAKRLKERLMALGHEKLSPDVLDDWSRLFGALLPE